MKEISQNELAWAKEKVEGYYLQHPNVSDEYDFEYAKAQLTAVLERQLEVVKAYSSKQFFYKKINNS